MENVTEVMGEVGHWERVAHTFGLGIPDSKLQEIKQQSYTERDRSRLAGEYWVNTDPDTSWSVLSPLPPGKVCEPTPSRKHLGQC